MMVDEGPVRSLPALHRRSLLAVALTALLFASATLTFATPAATTTPSFEQANATYASGNYDSAIAQYEAILAHDGYSAPVLFNLGNAFYRDGRFGAAILNYERALVLAPNDSIIASNLRLAREKAGVTTPALGEIAKAARLISPNTQAWTGSLALLAICLFIGVRRFRPQFSQAKIIVGFAIATLLAVATMFAIRWPEFNRAIVTAAKAPARIAPASTAAESFALKPGEPVTAVKTYGQFILVRTPDGKSGWVSKKAIGLVFKAKPNDGGTA
jgi:tetratricopeptide (TPR) repeat protein